MNVWLVGRTGHLTKLLRYLPGKVWKGAATCRSRHAIANTLPSNAEISVNAHQSSLR